MKGSLPCHVSIFKTQDSLSEDKTIPKAIFQHKPKSEDIVVFDPARAGFKSEEHSLNSQNKAFILLPD